MILLKTKLRMVAFITSAILMFAVSSSLGIDGNRLTAKKHLIIAGGVEFVADQQKVYGGTGWAITILTKDSEEKVDNVSIVLRDDEEHVIFDGCIAGRKALDADFKRRYPFFINESQLKRSEVAVTLADKNGKFSTKTIDLGGLSPDR